MKVSELIAELQVLDQDLQVAFPDARREESEQCHVISLVVQTRARNFDGKLTRCVILNPTLKQLDRAVK